MTEKITAKSELAALSDLIKGDSALTASVNVFLQKIMTTILGSLTRMSGDTLAQAQFIKGIGSALKQNKVACKYKSQLFDFMEWEAGVWKDDDGNWRAPVKSDGKTPDNSILVEACKKAKTEGFTGYVSEEKKKLRLEARNREKMEDSKLTPEQYLIKVLEDALSDAQKKAERSKIDIEADRWRMRAAVIETTIKSRKM